MPRAVVLFPSRTSWYELSLNPLVYNLPPTELEVEVVDEDIEEGLQGLEEQGSSIFLPTDLFNNRSNVTVASIFYRNLSSLLPDTFPGGK